MDSNLPSLSDVNIFCPHYVLITTSFAAISLFCYSPYLFSSLCRDNTDVVFLAVDVDACGDVAEECAVSAMPTFHFYKEGVLVDKFEGASEQKLTATIAKYK